MGQYPSHSQRIGKKIAAFSIMIAMMALVVPFGNFKTVEAASYVTSSGNASGSVYAASDELAGKLNTVFAGNIGLSSSTNFNSTTSAPLGSSVMTGSRLYFIKNKTTGGLTSGWQCFIYANAVYNTLFNETVGRATSLSHSTIVLSGGNTVSYNLFKSAGVKCGAYIRTTNRSNGAYNSSTGHSMIVLSYNSYYITYLEGNADGRGLVRIATRTWSDFNSNQLSGRGRYICHVVQPTDTYYNSLYNTTTTSSTKAVTTTTAVKTTSTTDTSDDPASCKVSYSRVLSYKSSTVSGNDVKYVQTCLKYLGYTVTVNSKYDSATFTAVKKFQSASSLTVDGKCGSATWRALETAVAAKKNGTSVTTAKVSTTTTTTAKAVTTTTAAKTTAATTAAVKDTLKITKQPVDCSATLGNTVTFVVKATGTGLSYQWQLSDDGTNWRNSSIQEATYRTAISDINNNRQVRCVITDQYGNQVTSGTATMKIK